MHNNTNQTAVCYRHTDNIRMETDELLNAWTHGLDGCVTGWIGRQAEDW